MDKSGRFTLVLTVTGEHPVMEEISVDFQDLQECEQAGSKWVKDTKAGRIRSDGHNDFTFTCLKSTKKNGK